MTPEQQAALNVLFSLLTQGGLLMGALILIVFLYMDKLVAGKRLTKAEDQRDEALKGWREQAEATKTVADAQHQTLEYLREELPRRRATPRNG